MKAYRRFSFPFYFVSIGVFTAWAAFATPRPPGMPLPELVRVTFSERFDGAYLSGAREAEVAVAGLGALRESWSGYALRRVGEVTPFVIGGVDRSGHTNVSGTTGAVRLWFKPDWSGASTGEGAGPGHEGRVLELSVAGGGQWAPVWSLRVSAEGSAISLVAGDGKESVVLLEAAIAWRAGEWHQVVLNYGEQGTGLVLDGEIVAEGAGVLGVSPSVAALTVGSGLAGTESVEGEIEEVYCFGRPLRMAFHYLPYKDLAARGPVGAEEMAYQAELAAKRQATQSLMAQEGESAAGGGMEMLMSGPVAVCVTNAPLFITNTVVAFDAVAGWTVQFEIHGTNGPADMFTTTNLVGNNVTNAVWDFLERGPSCAAYQYTNQSAGRSFYILGTTNDADFDLLTDAYELLASKTLVNDPDTDDDGMPDGWEVHNGLNPLDPGDAGDDPDGDWLTNLQEYNGGVDSTDPHDVMVVAWGDNTSGQCNVPLDLRKVIAVAGGENYSVALRADGTVIAWGGNSLGGTNVPAGLSNAVAISANGYSGVATPTAIGLALDSAGGVTQWGTTPGSVPADLTNAIAIAAGAFHCLALRPDGTVIAWGDTNEPAAQPPAGLSGARALATGWYHGVAILADGSLGIWGLNAGNLGWNLTNAPGGLTNVKAVSALALHTVALRSNGTVVAWGYNQSGQTNVPAGLSNITAVAAGAGHSMALKSDGTVRTWGGIGELSGLDNVSAIGAGWNHALAVRTGRLLPAIIQQPQSVNEIPGANATFTALGLGLAGVKYQWQFDGVNITGQTNANLTVTSISTNDEGNYTVVISTGAGAITSSVATLTLIGPPVITNTVPLAPVTNVHPILPTHSNSGYFQALATALETGRYPLRYQWFKDGSALAGETNSILTLPPNWRPHVWETNSLDGQYTVKVWNPVGTNEAGPWVIRIASVPNPGSAIGWGANSDGQVSYPTNLEDAVAIAAGQFHSVAAREDGSVVQWGYDWGSVPADLTNAVSVAAGYSHTLALRRDGTVVAWGESSNPALPIPTNLWGVKAIGAGWNHNVALLTNGGVTAWGLNGASLGWHLTEVPADLTNATAIAAGALHSVALRAEGTVQCWGYNDVGQCVPPAGLSNVVAVAAGMNHSLALKSDGTVVCWGNNSSGQCAAPAGLSNVMAVAAGDRHNAALRNDGTIVSWGGNNVGQTNVPPLFAKAKLIAAGGDHTLAAVYSPLVQYPVDVTKDLLLIYNANSAASVWVKDYYLAHRPMVGGANTLELSCATNEIIAAPDYTNQILQPYLDWLGSNPTKHPGYVIAFLDVPSHVLESGIYHWSAFYILRESTPGIQPFVTCINFRTTNDCKAYIDKLEYFGTNYSPGQLMISPSQAGYQNGSYYFDDVHDVTPGVLCSNGVTGVLEAGVSMSNVTYVSSTNYNQHIFSATNVSGYVSWGQHGLFHPGFTTNGTVRFYGNSRWHLMTTIESFNGQRDGPYTGQSNFLDWFSPIAFGGTNYENTPVGAFSYVFEPGGPGIVDTRQFFGHWASGKSVAIAAWNAKSFVNSPQTEIQVLGDPFVTK